MENILSVFHRISQNLNHMN